MESSNEEKQLPKMKHREIREDNRKKVELDTPTSEEKRNFRDVILYDSDSDISDSDFYCHVCSKTFSGFVPFKQHEMGKSHAKALQKKKKIKQLEKIAISDNVLDDSDEENMFFQKPFAFCKTCRKQFGGPESYAKHLVSKTHKQKVALASILEKVQKDGEVDAEKLKELYKSKYPDAEELLEEKIGSLTVSDEDESTAKSREFECKDCDKSFSGFIPYTQHILSKVHAKTVKQNKLREDISSKEMQESAQSSRRDTLTVEDGILVCKMCTMSFSGPESGLMHLKSRGHAKNLEKFLQRRERKAKTAAAKAKKDSSSTGPDYEDQKDNGQSKSHDSDSDPSFSSSSSSSTSEDELPQDYVEENKATFYYSPQKSEEEAQQENDITSDIHSDNKQMSSKDSELLQIHSASGSKSSSDSTSTLDNKTEDGERSSLSTSERKFLFNTEKYNSYKRAMRSLRDDEDK